MRKGLIFLVLAMFFGSACGAERAEPVSSGIRLEIDGRALEVSWEGNASVEALKGLLSGGELSLQASAYGGFEQVAALPEQLESDDRRQTAAPGDIMLYGGSSIVVFYGSNSWSYTRLGRIEGLSGTELTELLGGSRVTLRLSLREGSGVQA